MHPIRIVLQTLITSSIFQASSFPYIYFLFHASSILEFENRHTFSGVLNKKVSYPLKQIWAEIKVKCALHTMFL